MQQPPERPFVPRQTPTKAQPAIRLADFTLSRPFVPGAERERIAGLAIERESDAYIAEPGSIPPIETFLDLSPASVTAAVADDAAFSEEYLAEESELPPIEHFTDPLPPVEDFAVENAGGTPQEYDRTESAIRNAGVVDSATTDWLETDWQQYDWRGAAALGDTPGDEASNAWASTDWDEAPRPKEMKTPTDAIATALDQIAQRLREGELELPGQGLVPDPATVAATLAALLGIKR